MAWKPKTIAGKILKGLVIGGAAVAGVAAVVGTGGAASPAVALAGKGLLGKIIGGAGKVIKGVAVTAVKGVSAAAKAGANLVSGITAEQRGIIHTQKDETRAQMQKLTAIEKLVKAGDSVESAASKIGVPLSQLKGLFGIPSESEAESQTIALQETADIKIADVSSMFQNKTVLMILAVVAGLFLLPKLIKTRR
jgi:hypothetical protein